MTDSEHSYDSDHVCDFINDAVVPNANAPVVLRPAELATTERSRVSPKSSEGNGNARANIGGKALQILLGRAFDDDLIHRLFFLEVGKHVLQRSVMQLLPACFF
jgi:hypothetical protein